MELAQLRGIVPPMLTPLTWDERPDDASHRRLVDYLIGHGVHGLWILGTSSEFAGLDEEERGHILEVVVDQVRGRVPVVANVSDCSTRLVLRHARRAAAAGVDALAATPPYYYPNSMDEVQAHFRRTKEAYPDLPLLIYNIPQTVKVRMTVAACEELAREGTVTGIKDTGNDLDWFRTLALSVREAGLGESFRMFLGTRSLIDTGLTVGAHGAIPATSNVAPREAVEAYEAAARGDFAAAARAQEAVLAYERLSQLVRGGSPYASTLGS